MKPLSGWTQSGQSSRGLRVAFDASALSLTVGAEEELMLVDSRSGRLAGRIEDVLERMGGSSSFQAELRAAQIEIVTRPWLSVADVGRALAVSRLELADAIEDDLAPIASGAHPTASRPGPISNGERYRAIAEANPWAALHMLTCGLHVHIALAGADRALAVHNALRSYLPEFAALSANSPYHRSANSGIASVRMQLNRSLARHGVPPAFPDWDAYAAFLAWGRAGKSIPDPSYHWWDLRLHPGHGTVEVRVCDTQTRVEDTVALVALAQTLVAWLAGRYDEGERLPVHDGHRIGESLWLAASAGGPRSLLDLDSGERRTVEERLNVLLEGLSSTARELGTQRELDRLPLLARACGSDRQVSAVRELGLDRLVEWLARETVESARCYLDQTGCSVPRPDAGDRNGLCTDGSNLAGVPRADDRSPLG